MEVWSQWVINFPQLCYYFLLSTWTLEEQIDAGFPEDALQITIFPFVQVYDDADLIPLMR